MPYPVAAARGKGAPAGFDPASITSLALWLDASQLTGLADTDPVSSWTDLSGNGRHVTQADSGKRPVYRTSWQNGLPAVVFDGSDDFLRVTGLTLNQPNTILVVGKSTTNNTAIFDGDDSSHTHQVYRRGTGSWAMFAGTLLDSALAANGNWHLRTAKFQGATSYLRLDGAEIAAGAAGAQNLDAITVGGFFDGTGALNGDVGELLVYNAALSAGDLAAAEAYLRGKWGV